MGNSGENAMRLKHKADKSKEHDRIPSSSAELHAVINDLNRTVIDCHETIRDLTRALTNCRQFMKDRKLEINYAGLDAAIARGEAALKE